jgi:hypothetical protein
MIGAAGLLGVVAGAVAAYCADRFPARAETITAGAGMLLIGGLALVGCALPTMI